MRQNEISEAVQTIRSIYEQDVELKPVVEQNFRIVIKSILSKLIDAMKKQSNAFAELFADIYHEDSNFLKSKKNRMSQKVELNLILEINGSKVEVCGLGTRLKNPHLGFIKVLWPSLASMQISFNANDGKIYLSPEKIFELLQNTCDSALTSISNRMVIDSKEYIIIRSYSEKKPFTINVSESGACLSSDDSGYQSNTEHFGEFGASKNDLNNNPSAMSIDSQIDIIPAIKLDFSNLPRNEGKWDRVYLFRSEFSCFNIRTFDAIPLKLSSGKPRFRISFLRIEKEILKDRGGCLEEITKLLKHSKENCFPFLNWYVLKAVLMWLVLERQHIQGHWRKENIEACFIDLMIELTARLDKGWVSDIFFTEFNRMDTLLGKKYYSGIEDGNNYDVKQLKSLTSARKLLHSKLDAYHRGNSHISSFFSRD